MTRKEVIEKIRADFAYRTPHNGLPLGHIVLTREEAEKIAPPPVYDEQRVAAGMLTAAMVATKLRAEKRTLAPDASLREFLEILLREMVPAIIEATEAMP